MAKTKKTAEAEATQVTETTQPAETAAEEKPQFTFSAAPAELQYDYKTRNKVAKFRKVSFEQWKKDMHNCGLHLPENEMKAAYDSIKLPKRATTGSAGYDFYSPIPFSLSNFNAGPRGFTFPTGIRCEMNDAYCLLIIPRSGLGIRQYSRLGNTVACIDADYFYAGNEGDILINLRSDIPGNPPYHVSVGDAVCQGIFVQYGVTDDDDATELTREQRRGGLGSTGK
jgi:dUTP pyrophosphatase